MRTSLSIICLVSLHAVACTSPILGAECAPGYALCGGACVDIQVDPEHCGACDSVCGGGQSCTDGRCDGFDAGAFAFDGGVVPLDGSSGADAGRFTDGGGADGGTGGVIDGAVADAGASDGGTSDGGTSDGGTGCEVGELQCGDRCVRPSVNARHCGGCDMACAAGAFCVEGSCTDECPSPRATCDGLCINLASDPDNCGACGIACPSGVCSASTCQAPLAGHLVLIGHDFRTSRPSMGSIAGNAVFLARENPTQVVVYEGDALPEAITGTDEAIDRVAGITGRTWSRVVADDASEVPLLLADADVFVVYAQTNADDMAIFELSKAWGRALGGFLGQGGTVVVFDGSGSNDGTHRVLVHAGLMSVASRTDISRRLLSVVAPGDAIALGLPLRYRAELSSVRFETTESTTVVSDGTGPVVIHQIVLP